MAAAAVALPPASTDLLSENKMPEATMTALSTPTESAMPHPQADEIIRQIDYYFGEDNLPHDRHLLGMIREGKGTVSLNEILSFAKLRQYKPKSAVKEAVKQSTVVEIVGKRLRRRYPLKTPISVTPRLNRNNQTAPSVVPEDKPWLTKGMMKPTGFEEYATDGPVKPQEFEEDCREYDPDNAFTARLETAITKFTARRKMHQSTRAILDKFMIFGGMESGQRQFTGGVDEKALEEYTKKEIAERTSNYGVSERVLDGLAHEERAAEEVTWIVDFELVAKGFLSSQFTTFFNWYDENEVKTATNVLRSFYNYLLLHDVCTEYKDQLLAARKVCDQADDELPKLKVVDCSLPGDFSIACSVLFEGWYADMHATNAEWEGADGTVGMTVEDARHIFRAGIFAHGTEEQLDTMVEFKANGSWFHVVCEEKLGLEVIGVESANDDAKAIYDSPEYKDTVVHTMGKLRCRRWTVPHAPPMDLPKPSRQVKQAEEFEFLVEEDVLKYCFLGLKMEVVVKELDLGVKWIDYIEATYASFFTWLPNERIREWKEPGAPKSWMMRQHGVEEGNEEQALERAEGDEDEPE